jgi:aryl-alcohol dehydrogenase-like predicted oxidoreductase
MPDGRALVTSGAAGPGFLQWSRHGSEDAMDYRRLGRSGLKVAPLCLGGNIFGWTIDRRGSEAVLDAYSAAGGNFIDTADVYSRWVPGHVGGESESVLGHWMTARGNHHAIVVATKVANAMGEGPNDRGLSRSHIIAAAEASLRRLQRDHIDVYLAHWDDREVPLEETLGAFDALLQAGKVRYIGASNHAAWRLAKALWTSERHGLARYAFVQPRYNLVRRDEYERELEPLCEELGLGVFSYSALAGGFLTGKYRPDQPLPDTPRAAGVQRHSLTEHGWQVLSAVERVAAEAGATPAQVALAWVLQRPSITAPIASARSPAQLGELLGALDLRLDEAAIAALDQASAWHAG